MKGLQIILERARRASEAERQPSNRRRATFDPFRQGRCLCGLPVSYHFDSRNRFRSCAELAQETVSN
jgi:hypothetical protein